MAIPRVRPGDKIPSEGWNAMADAVEGVDAYAGKGDLVAGDATGTPVRLAPGADGTVLTADASQASGLSWTTKAVVQKKTGNQPIASTTLADVTDLTLAVAANTDDAFEFLLVYQGSATSTGVKAALAVTGATVTFLAYQTEFVRANASAGTDNLATLQHQAAGGTHAEATLPAAATNYLGRIAGVLSVGAAGGTLRVQMAANAAGTLTVQKGSQARLW